MRAASRLIAILVVLAITVCTGYACQRFDLPSAPVPPCHGGKSDAPKACEFKCPVLAPDSKAQLVEVSAVSAGAFEEIALEQTPVPAAAAPLIARDRAVLLRVLRI
ncbi:MAG: hypothetical protein K2X35_02600 [Bryobacteraceae bacterium]|nr:hypothetical protein [Bryobacteraceae bacterium]